MDYKLKKIFIRKLLRKEGSEGFSLIELVVVVAVLAILTAVGLPNFLTVINQAIFAVTKASLAQSYTSCISNPDQAPQEPPIPGVVFQSTNCASEMSATINSQCTLSMHMSTGVRTGWLGSYTSCVSATTIANSSSGFSTVNLSSADLEAKLESTDFVMKDSFVERGCSAYALVQGDSWDKAQENAEKLGGHLTTPNNDSENKFLIDQFTEQLSVRDPNWGNGLRAGAWIGLHSDNNGDLKWANGENVDDSFDIPYGAGQSKPSQEYVNRGTKSGYHLLMIDPSGHAKRHGGLNGWWQEPATGPEFYGHGDNDFWGYNWGIAELPRCKK